MTNNPVQLAFDEGRYIWPKPSEHICDIVVSIGTGRSTDIDGMPENDPKLSSFLEGLQHLRLTRKIVMLRSILQSTSNCENTWRAFLGTLGDNEQLLSRCHRISLPFGVGQTVCCQDDWKKIKDTKSEALHLLSHASKNVRPFLQAQLSEQLNVIARQLIASLFFLTVQRLEDNPTNHTRTWYGLIRCRLGRLYEKQFQSILCKQPAFRILDMDGPKNELTYDPGAWDTTFSVPTIFCCPGESVEVLVEISLDGRKNWDAISGFPRAL